MPRKLALGDFVVTAIGIGVVVVGVLFWLSLYQYVGVPSSGDGAAAPTLMKINRLTGATKEFLNGRWIVPAPRVLPPGEAAKLIGYAEFAPDGVFRGNLHNGSGWTVTRVAIRLTLNLGRPLPKETAWDRTFDANVLLPPRSTSLFTIIASDVGEVSAKRLTFKQWLIVDAAGFPSP